MRVDTRAIVCAVRAHAEHGAIVRAMTPAGGLCAGYVRGGRSRRLRPVLMPGNVVQAQYSARTADQLAQLSVELIHSRAPLFEEPLAAAAIEWLCTLTAVALPEEQGYSQVYSALDGVLSAIEAAPAASGWGGALVRYELLILGELGFGLDLTQCAATGSTAELDFVSPKSGRAVCASAAEDYRDRLFALPRFMREGGSASWQEIFEGLKITGHFLARDLLIERQSDCLAARERLVDRLQRVTR